jgi:nitroreductase
MRKTTIFLAALSILTAGAAFGQKSTPVIDAILKSGTAPTFTSQAVDDAILDQIIACGIQAPSGRNLQPWHFTVVKSKDFISKVKAQVAPSSRDLLFNGVTFILISTPKDQQYGPFDCGSACGNICLAAQSLGLGTHISVSAVAPFTTGKDAAELRKTAGIPDNYNPLAVIIVGYTDKQVDAVTKPSTRNTQGVTTYVK